MQLKILVILLFIIKVIYPNNNNNINTEKNNINNVNTLSPTIELTNNTIINSNETRQTETPIGLLNIPSIELNNRLYNIASKHNNVEENITILKSSNNPSSKDSMIILAAHSGEGKIAYFNNLNKLKINDTIILYYNNKKYNFIISNISEQEKNGYINIQKRDISQLILTTCSTTNKNKQLIVESIIKESK